MRVQPRRAGALRADDEEVGKVPQVGVAATLARSAVPWRLVSVITTGNLRVWPRRLSMRRENYAYLVSREANLARGPQQRDTRNEIRDTRYEIRDTGYAWRSRLDEHALAVVPARATTVIGMLAGHWLRSSRPPVARAIGLGAAGAAHVVTIRRGDLRTSSAAVRAASRSGRAHAPHPSAHGVEAYSGRNSSSSSCSNGVRAAGRKLPWCKPGLNRRATQARR